MTAPLLTADELGRRLTAEFPHALDQAGGVSIEELAYGSCCLRQAFREHSLRPGGTISGATIMALGDFAVYVALLGSIGWVPLAVTTNLTINFLRKPARRDLLAACKLLKIGRRLAVGEVIIRSEGEDEPVAHVTATYSIPPPPSKS